MLDTSCAADRRRVQHSVGTFLAAVGAAAILFGAGGAWAQAASNCSDIQKMLVERKSITERLTAASKGGKKIDAGVACASFGKLVANGQVLLKWTDANKDWCQIPDSFVQGIKADHGNAITIRSRACDVASKQAKLEKQAREGGGASGGLLGGGGLQGASNMPKGAL